MKTRPCPVSRACAPIHGWDLFLAHIHEVHTDPALTDPERVAQADRILRMSQSQDVPARPARPSRPAVVVPKVTADPRTAVLWYLLRGDRSRARETIDSMGTSGKRAYLAQLTEVINMLWSDE